MMLGLFAYVDAGARPPTPFSGLCPGPRDLERTKEAWGDAPCL